MFNKIENIYALWYYDIIWLLKCKTIKLILQCHLGLLNKCCF